MGEFDSLSLWIFMAKFAKIWRKIYLNAFWVIICSNNGNCIGFLTSQWNFVIDKKNFSDAISAHNFVIYRASAEVQQCVYQS